MNWTRDEKEFLEINYLRMSNEQLAIALDKTVISIASQLTSQVTARTRVRARERDWDLDFGCQVTEYLPELSALVCCEHHLQAKGVPYVICGIKSGDGFAIFRANMGNKAIDGKEPLKTLWVKCHNHPVYGKALPVGI